MITQETWKPGRLLASHPSKTNGLNLIWTGMKCVKCDAMYSPLLPSSDFINTGNSNLHVDIIDKKFQPCFTISSPDPVQDMHME